MENYYWELFGSNLNAELKMIGSSEDNNEDTKFIGNYSCYGLLIMIYNPVNIGIIL